MASKLIGGLDEVGWGSCAGPIVSVMAVFMEEDFNLLPAGVKDSKKTTEIQRNMMFLPLMQLAHDVGIGWASAREVDTHPAKALQLSYKRAVEGINPSRSPDTLVVDGVNRVEAWRGNQVVEPKADTNHWQVSAASIIAKVYRDTIMTELGKQFPEYGFDLNKGYGTEDHRRAIERHGLLIHSEDTARYIHRQRYCRNFKVGPSK